MAVRLTKLTIKGFLSIRELLDFEPGSINVLIGANGAGKSNFISFFRLLSWAMASPGNLQDHIARLGGANAILHDGSSTTPQMEANLVLETEQGINEYRFCLSHAAGDTLVFVDESCRFSWHGSETPAPWKKWDLRFREAKIIEEAATGDKTAGVILSLLRKCIVYQFHNTSHTARIRSKWKTDDNRYLKEDGANLASFLLRLRDDQPKHYVRIVDTIRQIVPFFADFVLEPEYDSVMLRWRERNSDMEFSAAQASDGMLRVIALITLLLQPQDNLPGVLILDEPELGLHPYAINIVAGLLRSVADHVQVIVATQSPTFVDYFEPEEIIVTERKGRESTFRRVDRTKLNEWLEEYSVSELWEKNVIGGRPSR